MQGVSGSSKTTPPLETGLDAASARPTKGYNVGSQKHPPSLFRDHGLQPSPGLQTLRLKCILAVGAALLDKPAFDELETQCKSRPNVRIT